MAINTFDFWGAKGFNLITLNSNGQVTHAKKGYKKFLVIYKKQFIFSWLYIGKFSKIIEAKTLESAWNKAWKMPNLSQGTRFKYNWAIEVMEIE